MSNLISVNQLALALNDDNLIILDCRYNLTAPDEGKAAFLVSHIPNAQYVHPDTDLSSKIIPGKTGRHPMPEIDQLQKTLTTIGINSDSRVVCYDASGGGIAVRAWWLLKFCGLEQVSILNGGWPAWLESGYRVTESITPTKPGNYRIQPNSEWLISAKELNETSEQYCVFDARSHDRYLGNNETIDPVAGHIPGAVSAPFSENLDSNGYFMPTSELKQRFETLMTNKPCVHYCGSGVTACHNWFSMNEAGLNPGKIYIGSWSDWITDPSRPIEK